MKNAPNPMDEIKKRHRALAILQQLEQSPRYRLNIDVLLDWLDNLALTVTRDRLVTECRALEGVGFLVTEESGEVVVLGLTEAGRDVCFGHLLSDLVQRPGPN